MRTIVTGGAGFIGSHLVDRLLKDGHEVTVIDNLCTGRKGNLVSLNRPGLKFIKAGCERLSKSHVDLEFIDTDWVFHLAARADLVPSITHPLSYHVSNVDSTAEVLEASRRYGVKRFIYAASSSCYGTHPQWPTSEHVKCQPAYPYALTKYVAEQYVLHWGKVYGLPVMSLRLFNVYGPRARTNGTYGAVMGVFLAQLANKKPITIVGDGLQKRDFTYVDDVVDAFILAAKSDYSNSVLNISASTPRTINSLADMLGATDRQYLPKRPGEPEITWGDSSAALEKIEWEAKTSLEDGVKIMKKHLSDFKDAPVWTVDSIKETTKEWFERLS